MVKFLTLRLSVAELEQLQEAARSAGLPCSVLVRRTLFSGLGLGVQERRPITGRPRLDREREIVKKSPPEQTISANKS